jgi:hypothetical protein
MLGRKRKQFGYEKIVEGQEKAVRTSSEGNFNRLK